MTIPTVPTKTLKDFINGQGYGVAPSAVVAICEELLAVREAQSVPVAWITKPTFEDNDGTAIVFMTSANLAGCIPLFTAPPAPAVPSEITHADATELQEIAVQAEKLGIKGAYGAFAVGANWMRAKVLSGNVEPVSQGYTLPDAVPTEGQLIAFAERHRLKLDKAWLLQIWEDAISLAAAPTPTKAVPDA